MQTWTYPAIFERQPGEIIVRFSDFPEALTGAETEAEAVSLATDLLEEVVLSYLAEGREVPPPRKATRGEVAVPLEPVTAGRAAVSRLMAEQRINKVALAARMGKDEKVVRRILDGTGGVSMDTVSTALKAMGARPSLALEVA